MSNGRFWWWRPVSFALGLGLLVQLLGTDLFHVDNPLRRWIVVGVIVIGGIVGWANSCERRSQGPVQGRTPRGGARVVSWSIRGAMRVHRVRARVTAQRTAPTRG
jgi:hypothetical protein